MLARGGVIIKKWHQCRLITSHHGIVTSSTFDDNECHCHILPTSMAKVHFSIISVFPLWGLFNQSLLNIEPIAFIGIQKYLIKLKKNQLRLMILNGSSVSWGLMLIKMDITSSIDSITLHFLFWLKELHLRILKLKILLHHNLSSCILLNNASFNKHYSFL